MSAAQRGKRMSEYLCEDVQTGRRGGRDAALGTGRAIQTIEKGRRIGHVIIIKSRY